MENMFRSAKEAIVLKRNSIVYYSYILLFIVVFFYGLYHARSFLIPVSLAALFSMLLWPVARFAEKKGLSRAGGAGICIAILFLLIAGFLFFFAIQVANFSSEMSGLPQQVSTMADKAKNYLETNYGINTGNLFSGQEAMQSTAAQDTARASAGQADSSASAVNVTVQQPGASTTGSGGSGTGGLSMSTLSSFASSAFSGLKSITVITFKSFIAIMVLLVYVFLMLLYRHIFLNFIQKISPEKREAEKITREVAKVSQQYLAGRLIVIGILAVLNSAGLLLIGVKQAIFFGVLAALLNLIPYIGVLIGAGLPLIATIATEQAWWPVLAVIGLFTFLQLVENYFLTPKIVGSKVRLNALFTLMAVLAGGYLWGVAGMILFIPFLAMLKIILDHIEPLHPYGYLVGDPQNRTEKK